MAVIGKITMLLNCFLQKIYDTTNNVRLFLNILLKHMTDLSDNLTDVGLQLTTIFIVN